MMMARAHLGKARNPNIEYRIKLKIQNANDHN